MNADQPSPAGEATTSTQPATTKASKVEGRRPRRPRFAVPVGVAAVGVTFALVAACSAGGGSAGDSGGAATSSGAKADFQSAARDGVALPASGLAPSIPRAPQGFSSGTTHSSLGVISQAAFGRSEIKTAGISLRTTNVATIIADVEGVAATEQGFVDSENTRTDTHGVAISSLLTLRVPVDSFDESVAAVSRFGQLTSKKVTTQDVTGRVADVNSRVSSARDSIAQLRVLYGHATKLGDIIALESELSAREADLEALEAQQRALTDQTTLSTITVQVTRLPKHAPPTTKSDDHSGFIGGIKQGWDALVSTFRSVSHGLGAALPLGITLLAIAMLAWMGIRRLPRRADSHG